jgi:hypothetical protein
MSETLELLGRMLARFLTRPIEGFEPAATCDPQCLLAVLKPGDVLLVEATSRISGIIKYLTQSTWSHAAIYVGPIPSRREDDGEPHVFVEAELGPGVISAPLSKYSAHHTRICRPVGLAPEDRDRIIAFAIERIGQQYDLRNVVDLARYLLPVPAPARYRRQMIALGSGSPTRAICSTLIAQAFQFVRYPILPTIETAPLAQPAAEGDAARTEILHIRHHSLFAPRDFDISPYFSIVKPSIEIGFDYKQLSWGDR